jgi:hypothetical protein
MRTVTRCDGGAPVLMDDGNSGGWHGQQRAQQCQRQTARRAEWGERLVAAASVRRGTGPQRGRYTWIRMRQTHGGGGCMGCAWSRGGGRSADTTNARWCVVIEPPQCRRTSVVARWLGHTAMGRRGPPASGPCHSNSFLN